MVNAKDIKTDSIKLKVLCYGKSGTGKTTFACSFPKAYVFDFDNGMLSQRGKDVEYDTYKDWGKAEMKLQELETSCPYDTLVFDSVTIMQELMMEEVLYVSKRKMPTLHDWGMLINKLQNTFSRVTRMAPNVVVTAHEQLIQDDITSEVLIQPLIVGKKLPGQIPLWFDEVYRMQVSRDTKGKAVYQMLTRADVKYSAKSRLGVLDTVMDWSKDGKPDDPYSLIMNKIKGR